MSENDGMDPGATTRRVALKRGAVVAGALWVTPVVQALGITHASADQPSGSPNQQKDHVDAGRGNGSYPEGDDLDPGNSGDVNQGGD